MPVVTSVLAGLGFGSGVRLDSPMSATAPTLH